MNNRFSHHNKLVSELDDRYHEQHQNDTEIMAIYLYAFCNKEVNNCKDKNKAGLFRQIQEIQHI